MKRQENEAALLLVLDQLTVESEYLDSVVESSLEMQALLRQRNNLTPEASNQSAEEPSSPSSETGAPSSELKSDSTSSRQANTGVTAQANPASTDHGNEGNTPEESGLKSEQSQRLESRLEVLRLKIEQDFVPVVQGRRAMINVLKLMEPDSPQTPTLSDLAASADEPMKSKLKQRRNEIRTKLNQIQSISMGNQAVLLYTLDFYNRLLAGLSGGSPQSNYYNANGHSQQLSSGNIVRTNC